MGRLAMLIGLCVITLPAPATTLRCGGSVIAEGDPTSALLRKCGAPMHAERHEMRRLVRRYPAVDGEALVIGRTRRGGLLIQRERVYDGIEEYAITPYEIWTYNFGPERLMVEIEVSGGRIDSIRKGGGYGD